MYYGNRKSLKYLSGIAIFITIALFIWGSNSTISSVESIDTNNFIIENDVTTLTDDKDEVISGIAPKSAATNDYSVRLSEVVNSTNSNWTVSLGSGDAETDRVAPPNLSYNTTWIYSTSTLGGNTTLTWGVDLLSYNIVNANVSYIIGYQIAAGATLGSIYWEYSFNGVNGWTAIGPITKPAAGSFGWMPSSFNLSNCQLDGSESGLYLRLNIQITDGSSSIPSNVSFQTFDVWVYSANIQDTGSMTSLNQDYNIDVIMRVPYGGHGLNTVMSNYRLYFDNQTSSVTTADKTAELISNITTMYGTYVEIHFVFKIGAGNFTSNGTLYYRFYVHDSQALEAVYYFSNTYQFSFFDGTAPIVVGGSYFLYNSTATPLTVNYNQDLNFSMQVTDTGGMHLFRAYLYYKIGTCPNKTVYDGIVSYTVPVISDDHWIWFVLPESALNASVDTWVNVSIYDGSYNVVWYAKSFRVNDTIAPTITVKSSFPVAPNIQYTLDFLVLSFTGQEDWDASGFVTSGSLICWKFNTAPVNVNDYTGSNIFNFIITNPDTQWCATLNFSKTIVGQPGFTYNTWVYIWAVLADAKGNKGNSTYVKYYINDTIAPQMSVPGGASTNDPVGYNTDKVLTFVFDELYNDYAAGVDRYYGYFKINNGNGANDSNAHQFSGFTSLGANQFSTTISESWYVYMDTVYYWVILYDKANNQLNQSGSFLVRDVYGPPITLLTTYPNSNYTYARTQYNLLFGTYCIDVDGGSGFKNITLRYRYDTAGITFNVGDWYNGEFVGVSAGSNLYNMMIPKASVQARHLYYVIRSYDNDGSYFDIFGDFDVYDQKSPSDPYVQLGDRTGTYYNTWKIPLTVQLTQRCLGLVYVNGVLNHTLPYDAASFTHTINFTQDGTYNITLNYFNRTWSKLIIVDTLAPTAIPSGSLQAVYADGVVSLIWGATTDSGVVHYLVYRGTTADFSVEDPTVCDLVADTTALGTTDTFATAGTYYYKVVVVDAAGNRSPASDAVEVVIPLPSWLPIVAGVGITAVVGLVVITKLKNKGPKKTMAERGVAKSMLADGDVKASSKAQKSADSGFWDEPDTPTPKNDDLVWKDLSADAWTKSVEEKNVPTPSANAVASFSASPAASPQGGDVVSRFDPEMRELYHNAQEFQDMGQESMAQQSYQMLLRLAEKKNDQAMIDFIKKKMEDLYK